MSLLKCCECGKNVSEYADKCQYCGCPISIIKETSEQINLHLITFISGKTIDLTGIESKIPENELNSSKIWEVLEKDYNASISTCSVVNSMLKFNHYKYPTNFQKLYDDMCESNSRRVNANAPKCPMCGSTNIQKISDFSRASSILGFGILSKKIGKQWQCNNPKCKHLW